MKNSILHFKNVSKKYYKNNLETNALQCINLEIPKGSIYGIIGNNGAGKSTLFRCIIGLEELNKGSIFLDCEEIPYSNPACLREIRKEIGVVFQQLNLFTSRTVEENISYPLEVYGVPIKERKSRLDETISLMGLEEKRKKYPSQLSGGERQRVAIGRAIVNRPKILLCDEATSALDSQTFASITKLLKNLNDHLGITILAITHHSELVKNLCTHVAFLKGGCIEKHGPKQWILSKSADKDSFVTEFIGGGNHDN